MKKSATTTKTISTSDARLNQSKFNKNRIWRKNSEKWSEKTREIIWCKASLSSLIRLPIVHRDRRVQFEFLRRPQRPASLCSLRRPLFSHSLDLGPTPLKPGMIGAQRSDLLLGLFRPAKHSIHFDDIFSPLNLVPRNHFLVTVWALLGLFFCPSYQLKCTENQPFYVQSCA